MHVLEITFLMLKEQVRAYSCISAYFLIFFAKSAEILARTGTGRTAEEKKKDEE